MKKLTKIFMKVLLMSTVILVVSSWNPIEVDATVYHPVESQTDETPLITASGKKIDPSDPLKHRWIAVSRDLEPLGFTFGAKVQVKGTGIYDGVWVVQDRMNKRWKHRIDFLVGSDDPLGMWENIKIIKL